MTIAPQALAQERTDAPTGTIQGKALLAQDSTTVMPGTQVLLIKADTVYTGAAANADGYYMIDDAPVGRHTFRTKYVGYLPNEREVEVVAGKTTEVTLYVGMFVSEDDLIFSPSDAEKDLAKGKVNLLTLDVSDFIIGDTDLRRRYLVHSDPGVRLPRECWDALDRIRPEVELEMLDMKRRTVVYDGDQPLEVWVQSIRAYNDVVKAYLEETHGEDWEERVRERTWERAWEEVPACP